jgi:hypothetical protein
VEQPCATTGACHYHIINKHMACKMQSIPRRVHTCPMNTSCVFAMYEDTQATSRELSPFLNPSRHTRPMLSPACHHAAGTWQHPWPVHCSLQGDAATFKHDSIRAAQGGPYWWHEILASILVVVHGEGYHTLSHLHTVTSLSKHVTTLSQKLMQFPGRCANAS